jgi:hypothetical protein
MPSHDAVVAILVPGVGPAQQQHLSIADEKKVHSGDQFESFGH